MRHMELIPIYQKPDTSKPAKDHKVYPYLLKYLKVTLANHVWCADITYIPIRCGFLYLVEIMDCAPRKVLSWRLYDMMEAELCVGALSEGKVEIDSWIKLYNPQSPHYAHCC